ncbi:MAG: DUF1566 domain-containing protein [Planctomycetaceae bacterium]
MLRFLLASLLIINFVIGRAGAEDLAALKLDAVGVSGGGFAANLSLGWEFDVTEQVTVKELGVWDSDGMGLAKEIPVAIWDPAGKLIVTATVPAGTETRLVDRFRYVAIDPQPLPAGRRYVVAALYTPKTTENVISANSGISFSSAGPIRWLKARRGRTETLSLPEPSLEPYLEMPGCFGPNFLLVNDAAASKGVRTYYRTREVQPPVKYQTIALPEKPDGSHREDRPITVSLFATADGSLTQVLIDDLPLGTGDAAFTKLASEIQRLNQQRGQGDRPLVRVAAVPSVKLTELKSAMNVAASGHFDASRHRSLGGSRGCDLMSLYAARVLQAERNGRFIVPDRFRDAGEYVEDRWTGLLWQKNGAESGKKNFQQAAEYAKELELGGLKDWRVPTSDELATIFPATFAPFTATKYNPNPCCQGLLEFAAYWTSELDGPIEKDYAFVYQWYAKGGANNGFASKNFVYVRCVHDPSEKKPLKTAE